MEEYRVQKQDSPAENFQSQKLVDYSPVNLKINNSKRKTSETAFNASAARFSSTDFVSAEQLLHDDSHIKRRLTSSKKREDHLTQEQLHEAERRRLEKEWKRQMNNPEGLSKPLRLPPKQVANVLNDFFQRQTQHELRKERRIVEANKQTFAKGASHTAGKAKKTRNFSQKPSSNAMSTARSSQPPTVKKEPSKRVMSFETEDRGYKNLKSGPSAQVLSTGYIEAGQEFMQFPPVIQKQVSATGQRFAAGYLTPALVGYEGHPNLQHPNTNFVSQQYLMPPGVPPINQVPHPTRVPYGEQEYFKIENSHSANNIHNIMVLTPQGLVPYTHASQLKQPAIAPPAGRLPQPNPSNGNLYSSVALQEEILDEFNVPPVNNLPRGTEYSMTQRSFANMQIAINQSMHKDLDNLGLHNESQLTNQVMMALQQSIRPGPNDQNIYGSSFMRPDHAQSIAETVKQAENGPRKIGTNTNLQLSASKQNSQNVSRVISQSFLIQDKIFMEAPHPNVRPELAAMLPVPNKSHSHQANLPYQTLRPSLPGPSKLVSPDDRSPIPGMNFGGLAIQQSVNRDMMHIDMLDSEFGDSRVEDLRMGPGKRHANSTRKHKQGQIVHDDFRRQMAGSATADKRTSIPGKPQDHFGKIMVSKLDGSTHSGTAKFAEDPRSNQSFSSKRSLSRQANNQIQVKAMQHIQNLQDRQRQEKMAKQQEERRKKKAVQQQRELQTELYLANKLTRQFIMVTSLVMQSEDLSEDSIFNYSQYTEFALRFGLMTERAAMEESDERALLYEMWCTLSRVHTDCAFIKVVNLKTIVTAILGFPVATQHDPSKPRPRKKTRKSKPTSAPEPQQTMSEEDSNFADNLDEFVPMESAPATFQAQQLAFTKGTPLEEREIPHNLGNRYNAGTIEELEELDQVSSPEQDERRDEDGNQIQLYSQQVAEEDGSPDKDGFDDSDTQKQYGDEDGQDSAGERVEPDGEFAIDRAHKIGFFLENFEFILRPSDVKTLQRRFKLFYLNWKEFQKKDLIVKKSVIVDEGITFHPAINKKSLELVNQKFASNMEFPLSNNTGPQSCSSQRRVKIWEKELPRGMKYQQRAALSAEKEHEEYGVLQKQTHEAFKNLRLDNQNAISRTAHKNGSLVDASGNEYFTLGDMHKTNQSGKKSDHSSSKNSYLNKQLTVPKLSSRMERIYDIGKTKLMTRQDVDKDQLDYVKGLQECTFRPAISSGSRQITNTLDGREKPWSQTVDYKPQMTGTQRIQQSIYKDIERKMKAQKERAIKNQVLTKGGWIKDFLAEEEQQPLSTRSQQNFPPANPFKNYKNSLTTAKKADPKSKTNASRQKLLPTKQISLTETKQRQTEYHSATRNGPYQYPLTSNSSRANLAEQERQGVSRTHAQQLPGAARSVDAQGIQASPDSAFQQDTPASENYMLGFKPPKSVSNVRSRDDLGYGESNDQLLQPVTLSIPAGASYPKSDSCSLTHKTDLSSKLSRKPLLHLDVDAADGTKERINVFRGDDARKLADDFCNKHGYDVGTKMVLQKQIEERMEKATARLEAKLREKQLAKLQARQQSDTK